MQHCDTVEIKLYEKVKGTVVVLFVAFLDQALLRGVDSLKKMEVGMARAPAFHGLVVDQWNMVQKYKKRSVDSLK